MKNKSYTTSIEVPQSAKEVFNAIHDVKKWWSKDFEGNSTKLNDEFIINHPGLHYSKQKLVDVVPDKKIVWLVTDSTLNWLEKDKHEWTNTKMIFEINSNGDKTVLHFTHEGLVPEQECYSMCEKGWDIIIKDWLYYFITMGTSSNEMDKAAEIRNKVFEDNAKRKAKDFHKTIIVDAPAEKAMKRISEIDHWWKNGFTGDASKLNSNFHIPFGDVNGEQSFVDFVVSEVRPGKKLVWKVTDCYLPWFENKKEWNNTEIVFDLSEENTSPDHPVGRDKTKIDFTHVGLIPEIECYDVCEKGWTGHINNLAKFINKGIQLVE